MSGCLSSFIHTISTLSWNSQIASWSQTPSPHWSPIYESYLLHVVHCKQQDLPDLMLHAGHNDSIMK